MNGGMAMTVWPLTGPASGRGARGAGRRPRRHRGARRRRADHGGRRRCGGSGNRWTSVRCRGRPVAGPRPRCGRPSSIAIPNIMQSGARRNDSPLQARQGSPAAYTPPHAAARVAPAREPPGRARVDEGGTVILHGHLLLFIGIPYIKRSGVRWNDSMHPRSLGTRQAAAAALAFNQEHRVTARDRRGWCCHHSSLRSALCRESLWMTVDERQE